MSGLKQSTYRQFNRKGLSRLIFASVAVVVAFAGFPGVVLADVIPFTSGDTQSIIDQTPFYEPNSASTPITCSTSSTPSVTNTPGLKSGSDVYILGDSITERSESAYVSSFQQDGITAYVDASSGRSLNGGGTDGNQLSGMQAIAADQPEIQKAQAIVIALGTNDGDTNVSIEQAITALNTKVPVYWVDTVAVGRTASPGEASWDQQVVEPNNQAIYTTASSQNFSVVSWYKTVDPNGDPQKPNGDETDANGYIDNSDGLGVHPTPAGINALVNLVTGTVTGNTPTAPTSSSNGSCCTQITLPTSPAASNLDYAGRPILDQGQLQAIAQYAPTYKQAATEANIPWQMLAAIHYREDSLQLVNPSNGYGIYQITNASKFHPNDPSLYAAGPITSQQFLQESIDAANFVQSSAVPDNYTVDQTLTANTNNTNIIKDTFFSYNGRADAYINQAAQNGFNPNTQGYEGSSYVMNKADEKRDAAVLSPSEQTWGYLAYGGNTLYYPSQGVTDGQYGAFVVYADLTGISSSESCSGSGATSQLQEKVVQIAEQQLQEWNSGQQDYTKYGGSEGEDWCAFFVSWVYNQAGYPLNTGGAWQVAWVPEYVPTSVQDQYNETGFSIETSGRFVWHPESGNSYTPQPGDIAVHNISGETALSHVNLVVGVSGNQATFIGGNEPGVQENTYAFDGAPGSGDTIIGYASPNGSN